MERFNNMEVNFSDLCVTELKATQQLVKILQE